MTNKVKAIPDGYHSVTPYLTIRRAAEAIEFYKKALGAKELFRFDKAGKVSHAELQIGDSRLMLADEFPEMPDVTSKSPSTLKGTTFGLNLYVEDADALFARAVKAGGIIKRPLADQFYGDRSGTIEDPFGHLWTISSHVEDVSEDELKKRMAAMPKG